MSSILSEIIQANSKTLPKWNVGPLPDQGVTSHAQISSSTQSSTVRNLALRPRLPLLDVSNSGDDDQENTDSGKEEPDARLAEKFASAFTRAEKDVLDTLAFTVMQDREMEIAAAESATFDWIFEDPKAFDRPWSNFHEWLAVNHPDRLYWISGKAGSGKSTLMKYLARHRRTEEALQQWAGSKKLLLSSFFFWHSGLELQRSQIGVLRALLYSCFKNHRELIPIVVPDTATLRRGDLQEYWNLSRLREALERLVSQTFYDIKFAFFFDKLDEYDSSYGDIINILKQLVAHPNVKVCVSSQPLLAFERAFVTSPQLVLQNLTYDDISLYVSNKLGDNERMQALEIVESGLRSDLTSSIVTKASGVFLWVHLVVRSLLDSLGNYDVGADLKRRVDDLPAELEALY